MLAASLALLAGCDACGRSNRAATGAYVRCLSGEVPALDGRRIGGVTLRERDRMLTLEGLAPPVTVAAFAGPAFADPPGAPELDALRAARPQVLLVLGGVGDTQPLADKTVAALATLSVPTLVLAGGRDSPARIDKAIEALDRDDHPIIPITALRAIRIAGDTFIPVGGAAEGRYALDESSCGYGADDLDEFAAGLELPAKSRRWLLAWEAPASEARHGVARVSAEGPPIGSPLLADFAAELDARGGLFAWPEVQAMRPSAAGGQNPAASGVPHPDLQLVVPRLTGPALERSDGSRVPPGFVVLQVEARGLRIVADRAVP